MCRPIIQYAAVMNEFTDRAAEALAASMILDTSPKMDWYRTSNYAERRNSVLCGK